MNYVAPLTTALLDEANVVTAWLFGSQARGTARANSDIDVAVLFSTNDPMERFDVEARLCLRLRAQVQVIDARRAPADLFRRVIRDGIVLVDRNPAARLALIVRKRGEYFEMAPLWSKIRRLPAGVSP